MGEGENANGSGATLSQLRISVVCFVRYRPPAAAAAALRRSVRLRIKYLLANIRQIHI